MRAQRSVEPTRRMFMVPASAPVVGTSVRPLTSKRWIWPLRYHAYPAEPPTIRTITTAITASDHLRRRWRECRPRFLLAARVLRGGVLETWSPRARSPDSSKVDEPPKGPLRPDGVREGSTPGPSGPLEAIAH